VHDDVERLISEVRTHPRREPVDREVTHILVALALAQFLRGVFERVVHGIERIDLLK
jgi:hypothetical protein